MCLTRTFPTPPPKGAVRAWKVFLEPPSGDHLLTPWTFYRVKVGEEHRAKRPYSKSASSYDAFYAFARKRAAELLVHYRSSHWSVHGAPISNYPAIVKEVSLDDLYEVGEESWVELGVHELWRHPAPRVLMAGKMKVL